MNEISYDAFPAEWKGQVSGVSDSTSQPGRRIELCDGLPLTFNRNWPDPVSESSRRRHHLLAKRIFDVVASLLALVFLMPLLIFVSIAIKLNSPGPVIFRQQRCGLAGGHFEVFKFRTLHVNRQDATGVTQTSVGDSRVTSVGRFLRRTSIDELPQLVNILRGDMSVVGPRPHVPDMLAAGLRYDIHVPYYNERLAMRPGLTGWAQCHGLRGDSSDEALSRDRINYDIAYIQNFTLSLDLRIIALTIREVFRARAY